jgi:microcystin-dependent protein
MADKRRNLGIPSGVVFPFAGTAAPYGYLVCDGSAISRTEYPALFSAIGTSHGQGDGSTTFNLPDYRGRFMRGVDGAAGRDPDKASRSAAAAGGNTGDAVGSAQGDNVGNHTHLSSAFSDNGLPDGSGDRSNQYYFMHSSKGTDYQLPIDGNGGTESRPKNVNVNYIIKV